MNTDKLVNALVELIVSVKYLVEAKTLKELPPGSATTGGSVHINSGSFSKSTK